MAQQSSNSNRPKLSEKGLLTPDNCVVALIDHQPQMLFGVSNFDVDDMEAAFGLPGGDQIATNQVLYNLMRRGIEWDLLPWSQEHKIPIMAYSPIEQGRLLRHPALVAVATRHGGVTPAQVALAWLLRQDRAGSGSRNRTEETFGS